MSEQTNPTNPPAAKAAPANEHLIWVDMEMSGLNPETERILEIAIIVTDATGVNNPAPTSAPATSSTPAVNNVDKRDGLRSRDREAR